MCETNFTEKVLKAFRNIINEIEKGSTEFEVRRTFDELFLRSVLGYERRDIKWEKKRADLTIVDENDFAVVKIETKRPTEDIDKAEHVEQAFKYEEETTKYIGLSNFLRLKLWEIKRTGSELKVDVDFSRILEQKKSVEQLSSEEKTQILFLSNLAKGSLFDTSKYERFDETYARIDITKEAGFQKLLDRLNYIANDLLLGYSLRTFEQFKEGYGKYQAELSRVENELKSSEEGSELSYGLLKYRQKLDEEYKNYKSFSGFWLWKEYSGKKDIADEEVKEIFCKESIYVLLNKLLFIRIGEDKNLLPKNISNGGIEVLRERTIHEDIVYKQVLEWAFTEAHHLYPHFYETGILDWFRTGDGELNQLLNKVLWILNQFDFTHVDRDILGNLYEKYLPGGERKKLGEFYTPVEVIRYILTAVGYTYSYEIETKDLLDPACGSGGFLVEATRRLTSRFLMKFGKANKEELRDPKNWKEIVGRLTPDEAKIILEAVKEHIYGLDINPFACHIAEMNMLFQVVDLYQKVREKYKDYKLGRFKIYQTDSLELPRQKQLADYTHAGFLEEQEEIDEIKNKKFDFVVGNPPYVRVQLLDEKTKEYLKRNYSTSVGKFDIYIPFIERGLTWLKKSSKLGFINPNLFLNRNYGFELRKFLLKDYSILQIIDFGDSGVFKDVTNYPCILAVQKIKAREDHKIKTIIINKPKERVLYDVQKKYFQISYRNEFFNMFDVEQKTLGEGNWKLKPQLVLKLMDKLDTATKTKLEDLRGVIHEGIITGDNAIFFVDERMIKSKGLESGILKRVPKGRDVRKWKIIWNDRWLIYPQHTDGTPLTESEFKTAFPNAYHYLEVNKDKLSNRRYYGKTVVQLFGCWYSLIHPKPESAFEVIKIVTPNLSKENNFALDKENYYFDHDTYSIILKDKSEPFNKFVLGLLNSDLLEFYLKQISPYASGKYYRYMTGYLEKIPIKLPETEEEKRIAEQIVNKVDEILELNRKLSVDIDELLKGEETEKLPYLASVSFSIRDDAIFERVEVKGDKIFVNSEDYIEIKDNKIRDFVVVYLNSVAEKLKKSKDVKGLIYNIAVPKSDGVLNETVRKDKTKIEEEIRKLEGEINELVFEIYGVTEEREIVKAVIDMNRQSLKEMITLKEHIINYAKNKRYFHINDLKLYFTESGIDSKKDTLKKYLYLVKKENFIYEAGRGWYSTIKDEFELNTKPVKELIALIKDELPLLDFSCWSTEQIKGFYHHLPSQFVTFVYADKDLLQALKDFLADNDYNTYLNPRKSEVEKYVELKNQTVILRPFISSREPKNLRLAKIEKILVDLLMETKKGNLMDMGECQKIISNIILNYRINMAEMLDYAERRNIKEDLRGMCTNQNPPMSHFCKM